MLNLACVVLVVRMGRVQCVVWLGCCGVVAALSFLERAREEAAHPRLGGSPLFVHPHSKREARGTYRAVLTCAAWLALLVLSRSDSPPNSCTHSCVRVPNSCVQSCFSLSKAIQTPPQRTCLSLGRLAQLTILKANREYILRKQFPDQDTKNPGKIFKFTLCWVQLHAKGIHKDGLPAL
jgi:hypothetical protein